MKTFIFNYSKCVTLTLVTFLDLDSLSDFDSDSEELSSIELDSPLEESEVSDFSFSVSPSSESLCIRINFEI